MILPLVPTGGAAAGDLEVWTVDRSITTLEELENGTSLEITGGVNVSFDVPASAPSDPENSTPSLTVGDGLLVNGTALRPVTFEADDTIEGIFDGHSYLYIIGDGMPAQFLVQNCSFRNMNVVVYEAAGEFSDCVFFNCSVKMYDTPALMRNCIFQGSYLGVRTDSSENVTVVDGCRFDWNISTAGIADAAIYSSGNVRIENSRFTNFFWPIYSTSGSLEMAGCHISDADHYGIYVSTDTGKEHPSAPVIRDTVLENCGDSCIHTSVSANITNCTLSGSKYGVTASNWGSDEPFEVVLEGNRIFNNTEYGIRFGPPDGVNLSGAENNTFDDGAGQTNGKGRLVRQVQIRADTRDQWGSGVGSVALCWTDALGNPGGCVVYALSNVAFDSYHIDNDGIRRDHFPATFWAERYGVTCRTVLDGPADTLHLVFQIPPKADIAIGRIRTVPASPKYGDYMSLNVSVSCAGENISVTAILVVDGREDRLETLGLVPANATRSFVIGGMRADKGRHRVEVRLDPNNHIHETDEGNNNRTMEYVVAAPAPPPDERNILLGLSVLATVVFVVMVISLGWIMRKEGAGGRPR